MQRFLLYYILILHIGFTYLSFGQVSPSFVRIDPPSFVPVEKSFNTSLIFKLEEITTETIFITINKPNSIGINSATIISLQGIKDIPISTNKDDKKALTLSLNPQELSLNTNTLYQVLLECFTPKPIKLNKSEFQWIENIENIADIDLRDNSESKINELQIFDVQKTADKCLDLDESSKLQLKIINQVWENLYLEFWLKSEDLFSNLLTITKAINNDTLLTLSKNEFDFITIPLNENEIIREDFYLGKNTWNYIGIKLNNELDGLRVDVYVNSEINYSMSIEDNFDMQNLNFEFNSTNGKSKIQLDRLKLWRFNNNVALAEKNKHFLSYEADSSKVIYQTNFDMIDEFNSELKTANLEVIGENLAYTRSEAPLFSKSPKLTVNIGSTYNSIVWYVQEYSVAREFEIERSISGGEFQKVFSTLAEDDPLKIYYFTDELISDYEVAFYRVKQINYDDSEVFSAEVKIGNREVQEFKLSQNYPNPFNPLTSIYVEVVVPTEFKVNVYDLVGNTVSELYDGFLAEGMHTFEFDGSHLPSGIYFYEVISPSAQSVKKMILAK